MRAGCSALAVAMVATSAISASADPTRTADDTFQRGRALMAEKRYAEACSEFEQSQRLDPQPGTLFNLADCEAQLGKLATAWARYRELARNDANSERRAESAHLAAELAPRVPKLVIALTTRPAGTHVAIDGVESTNLIGAEIPVDLGDHAIVATAPGFHEAHETASVTVEGKVTRIGVTLTPGVDAPRSDDDSLHPVVPPPVSTGHRRAGKIAIIAGAGVTVAGLVVGGFTYTTWHHAETCTACDRPSLSHEARTLGDVSTGVVIAGLASAGVGLYLWRSATSSAVVTPRADRDQVGVAVSGQF